MCYLIIIAIPAKMSFTINQFSQSHLEKNMRLVPTLNNSITQFFQKNTTAFDLVRGTCSCDLYTRAGTGQTEKLRRKYQNKGWSEAKIQRALADKNMPNPSHLRDDVVSFLQSLLNASGRISLFIHWYNGAFDTEPINIKAQHDEQSSDALANSIPEEVIVHFSLTG